jgi:hypothetical protein
MNRQRFWRRARIFTDYALTLSIRTAWVGVIAFEGIGLLLEFTAVSLREGGFPAETGYGLFISALGALMLILPAIALTIVPSILFLAIAIRFEIRHLAFYCIAGVTMGLITLPFLSTFGSNSMRTWNQLVVDPGLRLCFSGLLAGVTLWRSVKATT